MDIPTRPVPVPGSPFQKLPHKASRFTTRQLLWTALIVGFLTCIITVVVPYFIPQHSAALPAAFFISVGSMPASPLYAVNSSGNAPAPLTVFVEGKGLLPALGAARATDGSWYYLLAQSSSTPVADLYQKKVDGSVMRLTTSATVKTALSYDSLSGLLAYQSHTSDDLTSLMADQDWDIIVFDPARGSESSVASGRNPQLASGGHSLFFSQGAELKTASVSSGSAPTAIAPLPDGSLYAIDAATTQLAVYNPATRQIDSYTFTHGTSLNYRSSEGVALTPLALGYAGPTLLGAYAGPSEAGTVFIFSDPLHVGGSRITVPALPNALPQRIYAYE